LNLKRWSIAGTAILVVAGAAPWGVGYLTEQQWQEATREVNSAQPFLHMETDQYRRGLMGSEVSGTATFQDPATGKSSRTEFEIQVSHGITGSLLDIRPADGWQPENTDWFPREEPKLTLETRIWGTATLELQMPVIEINEPGVAAALRSSGGLARIEIGHLGEKADMLLVWPTVAISGPAMTLSVEDIHLEQSLSWLSGDIWTGSGSMTIETLNLQGDQSPPVVLNNISLSSHSEADQKGEKLDSTVALELGSVVMDGSAFGPHRIEVALNGLDVAGWNDFSSVMTEMQLMAAQADQPSQAVFEQQMAYMQQLNDAAHGLAAAGFSAGIRKLTLTTPEGELQGSLDVSHPELSEAEHANMLMVMQRLTGSLDFTMPLALVNKYPAVQMQVAPLVKQGLLVESGGQLVMKGQMQDLVLDLNGVEFPVPPLF